MAALDIERQAWHDELAEDMKSWTPEARAKFREVMGAIAEGLRNRTLAQNDIGSFIRKKLSS